jgi:FkbM family methyltransferase
MVIQQPSGIRPLLPPPARRARLLAWRGIELVLDVGANEGQYATRLRQAGFRGRIVSFEPGSVAFSSLQRHAAEDPDWTCHNLALADRDGTAMLNVAEDSEGSSLSPVEPREVRNSPGSRFVTSERVRVARLDSIWTDLGVGSERIYIKLDTQGTELPILQGARRALPQADFVEAELSLVKLYEGGALFDEVVGFLDERGFALISLEGIDEERDTGQMLQVDAIFMQRDFRAEDPA